MIKNTQLTVTSISWDKVTMEEIRTAAIKEIRTAKEGEKNTWFDKSIQKAYI